MHGGMVRWYSCMFRELELVGINYLDILDIGYRICHVLESFVMTNLPREHRKTYKKLKLPWIHLSCLKRERSKICHHFSTTTKSQKDCRSRMMCHYILLTGFDGSNPLPSLIYKIIIVISFAFCS